MEIRTLGEGDAQAWWDLRLEALLTEPFAFGKAVEEHRETSVETTAQRLRETPNNFTLGAFEESRLIGMATFVRDVPRKERHKGRVFGVYVAAGHRRGGVGYALMNTLLTKARSMAGLEQVLLALHADNHAAAGLYRRMGFQAYGLEPRALKIGSEYADMEYMILQIER